MLSTPGSLHPCALMGEYLICNHFSGLWTKFPLQTIRLRGFANLLTGILPCFPKPQRTVSGKHPSLTEPWFQANTLHSRASLNLSFISKHYKVIISAKQNNRTLFQQTIIISLFRSSCERLLQTPSLCGSPLDGRFEEIIYVYAQMISYMM